MQVAVIGYCHTVGTEITKGVVTTTSNKDTGTVTVIQGGTPTMILRNYPPDFSVTMKQAPSKKLLKELHKQNIRRGCKR